MKLAVIFGLAALVAGGWAFEKQSRAGNERALSGVATRLAGRPVHVRCESFWHWVVNVDGNLGDVPFPDGRAASYTHITRGMCDQLDRFRGEPERPELACLAQVDWSRFQPDDAAAQACRRRADDMAEALITLTHESMHMRGWRTRRSPSATRCRRSRSPSSGWAAHVSRARRSRPTSSRCTIHAERLPVERLHPWPLARPAPGDPGLAGGG